jgi:hypothetical protein
MMKPVSRATKAHDANAVEAKPKSKAKAGKSNGRAVKAEPKGKATKATRELSEAKLKAIAERGEDAFVPDSETASAPISPRTIHTRASKEQSKRKISNLAKEEANEASGAEPMKAAQTASVARKPIDFKKYRSAATHTAVAVVSAAVALAVQCALKTCVC